MKTKPKIYIKPLSVKDIDHVMSWVNDPEIIKNFQNFGRKFTKKEELDYIKELIKSKINFAFSVFNENGDYIGQISINQISWANKLGRLALIIKKEYWGVGYAQQAIPLIIKFAFRKLRLNKVWLMAYSSNKKGLHVYEKVGFKQEGLLRQEYFWKGKYHDMVRMGILKSEFNK